MNSNISKNLTNNYNTWIIFGCLGKVGLMICKKAQNFDIDLICIDIIDSKKAIKLLKKNKVSQFYYIQSNITDRKIIKDNIIKNLQNDISLINCSYPRIKNYGKEINPSSANFSSSVSYKLGSAYDFVCLALIISQKLKKKISVINFSSIYGVIAPHKWIYKGTKMFTPVDYSVAKAGIIHLTKYFQKYFGNRLLRFNCISPGGILDNQEKKFIKSYSKLTSTNNLLKENDIFGTVYFLSSDLSEHIAGQNIIIDDGFTL